MGYRDDLLNEAIRLVMADRNNTHGPPDQDFSRTADIWTAMGFRAPGGVRFESHHVAMAIIGLKLSRLVWSPGNRDSWADIAGYSACGHETFELNRPDTPEVRPAFDE